MLGYARVLNSTRGDVYENPLKMGELVQLRSGGPLMVVEEVRADGIVAVTWMDRGGVAHANAYQPELLKRAARSFFGRRR
jgi:uncharacterized protein YodC (DUF2158 family)